MVECGHDGYRRLPGRPTHTRRWRMSSDRLSVSDSVTGPVREAEARFHLHPTVKVRALGPQGAKLALASGLGVDVQVPRGSLRQEPRTWHPEFGSSLPNVCLVVQLADQTALTEFRWASDH
jgi:Heparinase II/III-like protein